MQYRNLLITMIISFIVMYLVMFLSMDNLKHYHTSVTRIYMAMLMVAPMAIIMITLMGNMYPRKKINLIIITSSALIFIIALAGLRSQTGIDDIQYMKAMIPHHSSAIMTSKNANISDPEVKKLSKQIIESQEREIAEMENMLKRLSK